MSTTETLLTRGRGPFRQYLWTDRAERDGKWIERGVMLSVERRPEYRPAWCVRRGHLLAALLLRAWYGPVRDSYWCAVYLLWTCGLFEPYAGAVFSWWRDFRPFPWHGLRRERTRP